MKKTAGTVGPGGTILGGSRNQPRVVIVLKDIEGYSHAEIAEMEGTTALASRARLFRARETLRELLRTAND